MHIQCAFLTHKKFQIQVLMSIEQVADQIDITVVETDPSHLSLGDQFSTFQTGLELNMQ